MTLSIRRLGIAAGALVEAALVLWLLSGVLPAALPLGLMTVVLGFAIYRDIIRRELPAAPVASPWHRPVSPIFFVLLIVAGVGVGFVAYAVIRVFGAE